MRFTLVGRNGRRAVAGAGGAWRRPPRIRRHGDIRRIDAARASGVAVRRPRRPGDGALSAEPQWRAARSRGGDRGRRSRASRDAAPGARFPRRAKLVDSAVLGRRRPVAAAVPKCRGRRPLGRTDRRPPNRSAKQAPTVPDSNQRGRAARLPAFDRVRASLQNANAAFTLPAGPT